MASHYSQKLTIRPARRRAPGTGHSSSGNGYWYVTDWTSPSADNRGRVYEHVWLAEKALKYSLPSQAVVHHVDDNRLNNIPSNLVICEDQAYHLLLHVRARAYQATGNTKSRKCMYCHQWDLEKANYFRVWESPRTTTRQRFEKAWHIVCRKEFDCARKPRKR